MRHRGEGRAQRYSAADRNIGTISKRLGGQDIRVGAPTTTTTTTTATTTPRYVEGTKHHGSGRRTRIREILLEYQPAPFRSSSILCFRIGVWRKGERAMEVWWWITRGKPHGFACSWPAALTGGEQNLTPFRGRRINLKFGMRRSQP